jgi:CheY-like chemotaxis protein
LVLVVEDDPAARRAITLILKGRGYVVSEAATVADALAALAARPDWVLLDLMLPDGCGTRVLRHVAEQRLPSRVCVITGCGPERVDEARALGPRAVFKKPVDVERLLAVLGGAPA